MRKSRAGERGIPITTSGPGSRCRCGRAWLGFGVGLALLGAAIATPLPARAQATGQVGREQQEMPAELARRLAEQIRSGQLAAARSSARRYLQMNPTDGVMTYNLSCIEARLADIAAAWSALDRAFQLGFTDLHQVERDADLASLRADPRYAGWRADRQQDLQRRAQARKLVLTEQVWSEQLSLETADGSLLAEGWPDVSVRLRYRASGLSVSARIRSPRFLDRPEPWRRGDGLLLTIVVPPDTTGFESDRYFEFGFGLSEGMPVGALAGKHGERLAQRIVELDPKIHLAAEGEFAEYALQIPWESIAPYAPPLDPLLGLNVSYLSLADDGRLRRVALLADPHLDSAEVPWRRFVPVEFQQNERSGAVLRGRVDDTIVGDAPLQLELVAWNPAPGPGRLRIGFEDAQGRSILAQGPEVLAEVMPYGRLHWPRQADLSRLPSGPFTVRAELELADGSVLPWRANLLRLRDGWQTSLRERMLQLSPEERPSIQHRLDLIATALDQHAPRDDPGSISTTLTETGFLLLRAEETGTIFPDHGAFFAFYPDGQTLRPCTLHLPRGHASSDGPQLLLAIGGPAGAEAGLLQQIAGAMGEKDAPIVMIPAAPLPGSASADAPAEPPSTYAAAALRWATGAFHPERVWLAGLTSGCQEVLDLSLAQPGPLGGILLLIDAELEAFAGLDQDGLPQRLSGRLHDVPYTLVSLRDRGEAARKVQMLSQEFVAAGFRLAAVDSLLIAAHKGRPGALIAGWADAVRTQPARPPGPNAPSHAEEVD